MKNTISAIVLIGGHYDEKLLKKCLDSISWCDEIVKVDTANIDGSFSEWRNVGAKSAKSEWLLYIDTDEEITPKLKDQILQVVGSNEFAGYAIPRRNIFLGRKMHWGGWWPDYVLRLIKKDKLKTWAGDLHEQPMIEGRVCHLKEPLLHTTHRSLTEMVNKTNKWSEIEAKLLYESGHPKMNIFRFCSAGFREFWYRGIVKLGFLDGTVGVIEIIYQVYSRLITYSKLWELQLQNARSNI
jgi:glycosyltransferase involved in cell wall biosynthesis